MTSKTSTILLWICIALLALQFTVAAVGKLTGAAEQNFIRWGYNAPFMYFIGSMEALGVIGLFIPNLRRWAAVGLIGIMLGAAYTHIRHDEDIRVLHNLIICIFALGVVRFGRQKGNHVSHRKGKEVGVD